MQLSVFYHHIKEAAKQTKETELEVLKKVKTYGIRQLEFDIFDLADQEQMQKLLEAADFQVSSIYGFYDFGKNQNGTDGYALVDAAKTFGSDKVMIVPGFYKRFFSNQRKTEEHKMVEQMKKICDYAMDKGITPTIEDFDDRKSPIATANQMLHFTEELSDLKITFDTGNFMFSAEKEKDAYEILKDKIVHVHCKDRSLYPTQGSTFKQAVDGKKLYPSFVGGGCVAMKYILKNLKEKGYDDTLTIEHFDVTNYMESIEKSAQWIKQTWEELS